MIWKPESDADACRYTVTPDPVLVMVVAPLSPETKSSAITWLPWPMLMSSV